MSNKESMDKTTPLTIEQFQNQIEAQKQQIALQNQQIAELTLKLKWYEEKFRLNQKMRFGSSSEKTDEAQLTLPLFNEAEETSDPTTEEPTIETITYERHKKSGKREEQLKDLPVENTLYRLPEDEQTCLTCGNSLHEMVHPHRDGTHANTGSSGEPRFPLRNRSHYDPKICVCPAAVSTGEIFRTPGSALISANLSQLDSITLTNGFIRSMNG